jgi:hypothetical protein
MRQTPPSPQTDSGDAEITHHAPALSHGEADGYDLAWHCAPCGAEIRAINTAAGWIIGVEYGKCADMATCAARASVLVDRRSPEKSPD